MGLVLAIVFLGLFDWKTLKTEHFTIMYKSQYYKEAYQTLQHLEYYRHQITALTGNRTRNTPVVIEDLGTLSNGYADPFLYNIHVFTYTPGFSHSLGGMENWLRSVAVHEHTHIAHLSKTTGLSKTLTGLFGAVFQSNMYSPAWIIEGVPVYAESQISPYEGRLNDGFFDNYIGTRICEKRFPSIVEVTNAPLTFPYESIYLYGGEFLNYLSLRYGTDHFSKFSKVYGSYFWSPISTLLPCIGIDCAARSVYGKSLPALFAEWQQYEEHRHAEWNMEGLQVTKKGWYIYSLISYNNKLFFVRSKPIKLDAFHHKNCTQLIELCPSSGKETIITSLNSTITAPLRVHDNNIYYVTLELKRGMENVHLRGFGTTSTLHKKNLNNGKDHVILTDDIRAFCVLYDGTILYSKDRMYSHGSELWLYDYSKNRNERILETDLLIFELLANSDWIVTSASKEHENPDLYSFDLATGVFTPILKTPWRESPLCLEKRDRLKFVANFDGKHEIFSIFLSDTTISVLRHSSNGFSSAAAMIGDGISAPETLYYIGLNSDGYDIYKKKACPEQYTIPHWPPSAKPHYNSDEVKIRRGGYPDVLKTLLPAVRMPIVFPNDTDITEWYIGGIIIGGDAVNENVYAGLFANSVHGETPYVRAAWQSISLSPLSVYVDYNYSDVLHYKFSIPVLRVLRPGLTNCELFINGKSFDSFTRKEIASGFSLVFTYPYTTIYSRFSFPFERQSWGSTVNRNAQRLDLGLRHIVLNGEFRILSVFFSDAHNPDPANITIRGYSSLATPRGIVARAEFSRCLLKIRKGFWNPNVFIEDVFGGLFFDCAIMNDGVLHYSIGCELKPEIKVGFGFLKFIPGAGIAITKDRQIKTFFTISPVSTLPY